MAISSIHIEAGAGGFFAHNSRETKTKNSIFDDEENFCSCTKNEAFKIYKNELKKRTEAYTKRVKQKLQKSTLTHLSAIVNLNQVHTQNDLKLVCDLLEKELDTKVIQYAIHRDEGHLLNEATDEVRKMHAKLNEDDKIKNYHGHIEFLGLDSKGNAIRQKLTKKYLSDLQTKVANLLKMERGNYTMVYNQSDFYNQILIEMPKTDNLQDFKKEYIATGKKIRYKDKPKAKRKDTQHYKTDKEQEASNKKLAKQKDLKAEVALLKAELQANEAIRKDYAKLEQLNRDLKQQIKNKDITLNEMQEQITALKSDLIGEQEHNKLLENQNDDLIQKNGILSKKLSEARETILSQEATIDTQKQQIIALKQNISVLEGKNKSNLGLNVQIKKELEIAKKELAKFEPPEIYQKDKY